MEASLVIAKKGNPDIFLASKDPKSDDYFYIVHKNQLIGSIYMYLKKWYIWDRRKYYRYEVPNFSTALRIIEEDLCEA